MNYALLFLETSNFSYGYDILLLNDSEMCAAYNLENINSQINLIDYEKEDLSPVNTEVTEYDLSKYIHWTKARNNIIAKQTFLHSFPHSDRTPILTKLVLWQYWWWYWLIVLSTFYFSFFKKIFLSRNAKVFTSIYSSIRSHNKFGDYIACILPIGWVINIHIHQNALLKEIEWNNLYAGFTLRVRGKQWYWLYYYDFKYLIDMYILPKAIGGADNNSALWKINYSNKTAIYNSYSSAYLNKNINYNEKLNLWNTYLEKKIMNLSNDKNFSNFLWGKYSNYYDEPIKNINEINLNLLEKLLYQFNNFFFLKKKEQLDLKNCKQLSIASIFKKKYIKSSKINYNFGYDINFYTNSILLFDNKYILTINKIINQYNIKNIEHKKFYFNNLNDRFKSLFLLNNNDKNNYYNKYYLMLKKNYFHNFKNIRINNTKDIITINKTNITTNQINNILYYNNIKIKNNNISALNLYKNYKINLLNNNFYINFNKEKLFNLDNYLYIIKKNKNSINYLNLQKVNNKINYNRIINYFKIGQINNNINLLFKNKINFLEREYQINSLKNNNILFKFYYNTIIKNYNIFNIKLKNNNLNNNFYQQKDNQNNELNFFNKPSIKIFNCSDLNNNKNYLKNNVFTFELNSKGGGSKELNKINEIKLQSNIKQHRILRNFFINWKKNYKNEIKSNLYLNKNRKILFKNNIIKDKNYNITASTVNNVKIKSKGSNLKLLKLNNTLFYTKLELFKKLKKKDILLYNNLITNNDLLLGNNKNNNSFLVKAYNRSWPMYIQSKKLLNQKIIKEYLFNNKFLANLILKKIKNSSNSDLNVLTDKIITEKYVKEHINNNILKKKMKKIIVNFLYEEINKIELNRYNLNKTMDFIKKNKLDKALMLSNYKINKTYFTLPKDEALLKKSRKRLIDPLQVKLFNEIIYKNKKIFYSKINKYKNNLNCDNNICASNKNNLIKNNKLKLNYVKKGFFTNNKQINLIKFKNNLNNNLNKKIAISSLNKYFVANNNIIKNSNMYSKRLLRVTNNLILPCDLTMRVITNSYDIIHSWYIPGLNIKMDCIPGRSTHQALTINSEGFYYGQCAEICGRYHHHMPIKIHATSMNKFLIWWSQKGIWKAIAAKKESNNNQKWNYNSKNFNIYNEK